MAEQSVGKYAAIGPIAVHLPERSESNDQLAAEFPRWDLDLIFSKTGIALRHIAADGECASDLGVAAARKLFEQYEYRSRLDRFSALLHADARLPVAYNCLPDAGAAGTADRLRRSRL